MKKNIFNYSLVLLFMVLVISIPAQAKEESINNILGNPASTRNLLIGLGVLLIILIIIFVVLLLKPKKTAAQQSGSAAEIKPEAIPTIAVPMSAAQGGETQLLQNPIAELLVEQGSDKDMMFTISENTSTIGRSGTRINDVVLTDNTVSKKQALLQFDPVSNQFSIVNESAKNHTKVNGIITDKPVFLKDGDLIEMGKTALRFKIRSAMQ